MVRPQGSNSLSRTLNRIENAMSKGDLETIAKITQDVGVRSNSVEKPRAKSALKRFSPIKINNRLILENESTENIETASVASKTINVKKLGITVGSALAKPIAPIMPNSRIPMKARKLK